MPHSVFEGDNLSVEYSACNGELWFASRNDKKRNHVAVVDLNKTQEVKELYRLLKRAVVGAL